MWLNILRTRNDKKITDTLYGKQTVINASENIKQRVVSTVLRDELLKNGKLGNGTFEPKKLKREKVKEVLLSFRYNLIKDKETNLFT